VSVVTPIVRLLVAAVVDPAWRRQAACTQLGLDAGEATRMFYPDPGDTAAVDAAKAVCAACPVRQVCFDDAMANGERYGVWGGLSEEERAEERRRLRAAGERFLRRTCSWCGDPFTTDGVTTRAHCPPPKQCAMLASRRNWRASKRGWCEVCGETAPEHRRGEGPLCGLPAASLSKQERAG
jgi:hypothetical protein